MTHQTSKPHRLSSMESDVSKTTKKDYQRSGAEPAQETVKPRRIQLSRAKGFNLQAASLALNGLPAVKVDRTTPLGNPIRARRNPIVDSPALVVAQFRHWLENSLPGQEIAERVRVELRGKNLACWCKTGEPCHADVLLEIANA